MLSLRKKEDPVEEIVVLPRATITIFGVSEREFWGHLLSRAKDPKAYGQPCEVTINGERIDSELVKSLIGPKPDLGLIRPLNKRPHGLVTTATLFVHTMGEEGAVTTVNNYIRTDTCRTFLGIRVSKTGQEWDTAPQFFAHTWWQALAQIEKAPGVVIDHSTPVVKALHPNGEVYQDRQLGFIMHDSIQEWFDSAVQITQTLIRNRRNMAGSEQGTNMLVRPPSWEEILSAIDDNSPLRRYEEWLLKSRFDSVGNRMSAEEMWLKQLEANAQSIARSLWESNAIPSYAQQDPKTPETAGRLKQLLSRSSSR